MKKLSKQTFEQIRRWVYLRARHLEIAKWQYYFEGGSKDAVTRAISLYQNQDGGFGGGLDPDCSNPNSSPFNTINMAYDLLVELGCDDRSNPVMGGILRYVETTDHFTEQGWYWAVPTNNDYPCADYMRFPNSPWFPADWPPEKINNGRLSRFVLENFGAETPVYQKTLRMLAYRLTVMPRFAEYCAFANLPEQSMEAWDWAKVINTLRDFKIISQQEYERIAAEFWAIAQSSLKDANTLREIRYWKEHDGDESGGTSQEADLDALIDDLHAGREWHKTGLQDGINGNKALTPGELWWPVIGVIGELKTLKINHRLDV